VTRVHRSLHPQAVSRDTGTSATLLGVHRLDDLLPRGVARRGELALATSPSSVGRWLARGDLVPLAPGVVAVPQRATEWLVRASAAVLYADGPLSHISALTAAGLAPETTGPVHVTVSPERRLRDADDVVVHRSEQRLVTIRCRDLDVMDPARSLVEAWAWAASPMRNDRHAAQRPVVRQALIGSVRARQVRPAAVRRESAQRSRHPGRADLSMLLDLVEGGCQSELEIWGVLHVLPGPPAVPPFLQQHRITLPDGRRVDVDAAWPQARVAVELDGAAFHGSRQQRERDLRRDSALASAGWIVLRFSYARLVSDPEVCRQEIVAALHHRMATGGPR
jgi:REase_MTES_1575